MKRSTSYLIVMISINFLFAQENNYEPGVILLKVKEPEIVSIRDNQVINPGPQLQAIFQQYLPVVSRKFHHAGPRMKGWYYLKYRANVSLPELRSAFENCPDVKTVSYNHYGILADTPDDPLWNDQWGLQTMNMPVAWNITKADNTILVGVMDSGLDYTHEDLVDNVWQNLAEDADGDGHTLEWNGSTWVLDPGDLNGIDDDDYDNDPTTFVDDLIGWNFNDDTNDPQDNSETHGTRVAGVISARSFNNIGVSGIAGGWQNQTGVRLIGLSIAEPPHGNWTQVRAVDAIDYLTTLRQEGYTVVVNMSLQTSGITDEPMSAFEDAVADAKNAGVIMIAAAGNVIGNLKSPYSQPDVDMLPIPARYSGVIAIGASSYGSTLQNELRSSYSLYDVLENKLHVVAPVDKIAGQLNVLTTLPGNQYRYTFNGTSAASPLATGVVALMLSANPSLGQSEIENILASTAEKIGGYNYSGSPSRTNEVGYGRINAFQAVLEAEQGPWYNATQNKSFSSTATYSNSVRNLVKGSGYLGEVFTSDGEIFYNRSINNGQSWTTTRRISQDNGSNQNPGIILVNNDLHVVWERKISSSQYEVWHAKSTDEGLTWSDPPTLLTTAAIYQFVQAGATPAISHIELGQTRLMVVYCTQGGLKYRYSDNSGSSWSSAASIPLPSGVLGNRVRFPSLTFNPFGNRINMIFDTRDWNGVYSQAYDGSSWTSAVHVADITGTVYNRRPSITYDNSNLLAAWMGQQYSGSVDPYYSIVFRKGFSTTNTWDSWFVVFTHLPNVTAAEPAITGYYVSGNSFSSYGIALVHDNYNKQINLKNYYSDGGQLQWHDQVINTSGLKSGITEDDHSTENPLLLYTGQSASPYPVNIESVTPFLPKTLAANSPSGSGQAVVMSHQRRAVIKDRHSGAAMVIDVTPLTVENANGVIKQMDFKTHSLDKPIELTLANLGNYLGSDTLALTASDRVLQFKRRVDFPAGVDSSGSIIANIFEGNFQLFLEIKDADNPLLTHSVEVTNIAALNVDIQDFAGKRVVIKPRFQLNKTGPVDLAFAAGDVYSPITKFSGQIVKKETAPHQNPQEILLNANYPNPFNPGTQIRFSLSSQQQISLKKYTTSGDN